VRGRLVVFDGTGVEQAEESGTAFVSVLSDTTLAGLPVEEFEPRRVFVIEGRFTFKVRKGRRVRFELLELDHGQARPIPNSAKDGGPLSLDGATFPDPCADELVVRARYLPLVRVHLIDADDHAELSEIDVIREPKGETEDDLVYGLTDSSPMSAYPPPFRRADVRLRYSTSPVVLQAESDPASLLERWRERLWCHSPGHCWAPLDVDYLIGGESTVLLARSGSMRVRLTGPVPPVGARLVLKPSVDTQRRDPSPSRSMSDGIVDESEPNLLDWWPVSAEKESRFDGLPPGDYRLELQAGVALGPRYLLGAVAVTIERGKEAVVELAASPISTTTPRKFPVAIDLHLDPGWTDEPFDIEIEPSSSWRSPDALRISRPQLVPMGDALNRWTTAGLSLAPGAWDLKIDRFRIRRRFLVGATATSVDLDVGPPVDVAFHLVDPRSREPVLVRKIRWSVPARDASGARLIGDWPLTPRNHTLRARVPAGPIEIFGENDKFDWSAPVIVNVGAADRNVEVRLNPLTGVRVRFTLDGESLSWERVYRGKPPEEFEALSSFGLSWPDETAMSVVLKGAASSAAKLAALYDFSGESTCFRIPSPGTFIVTFRDPERFEAIAPREVSIPDERVVEVVIPLQRKE